MMTEQLFDEDGEDADTERMPEQGGRRVIGEEDPTDPGVNSNGTPEAATEPGSVHPHGLVPEEDADDFFFARPPPAAIEYAVPVPFPRHQTTDTSELPTREIGRSARGNGNRDGFWASTMLTLVLVGTLMGACAWVVNARVRSSGGAEATEVLATAAVATAERTEPDPAPAPMPAIATVDVPATAEPPASLIVSGKGPNPSCRAECAWGDLAENGFPKSDPSGKKTIVCGERTWIAANTRKITVAPHTGCYEATSLAAAP